MTGRSPQRCTGCEDRRPSLASGFSCPSHSNPEAVSDVSRLRDLDPDHPLVAEHEMIRSLHASAAGKLFLAADSQWRELPPTLPALTQSTVTEMRELAAQVEETRQRGYAVAVDEMLDGEASIAVPILDVEGVVRGAVAVMGFSARLDAITSLACPAVASSLPNSAPALLTTAVSAGCSTDDCSTDSAAQALLGWSVQVSAPRRSGV